MADIASSDVTYTQLSKEIGESGYRKFRFTVAFGNGALTYPSGGVPLDSGKLGCPNQIRSLNLYGPSSADGVVFKYDAANNKVRMYRTAATTPAGTIASHTHSIPAGTDGAGGTSGGTVATFSGTAGTAASLIELVAATTAPAATTLYVEVTGW